MSGPQTKGRKFLPFFMNSARLQTSGSYFKTNYSPIDLYDFEQDSRDDEIEALANQGYYGVPRFLPLKTCTEDEKPYEDNDDLFIKGVNKWNGFGLIWLTMRRILKSSKRYFWDKGLLLRIFSN